MAQTIEEDFLEPCSKCLGSTADSGVLCKLHYALVFLHYYANYYYKWSSDKKIHRRVDKTHSLSSFLQEDTELLCAQPAGRQVLTTDKLFNEVYQTWSRAGQGTLYYEV